MGENRYTKVKFRGLSYVIVLNFRNKASAERYAKAEGLKINKEVSTKSAVVRIEE